MDGWVIVPPLYALILHGIIGGLLAALLNFLATSFASSEVPLSGDILTNTPAPSHSTPSADSALLSELHPMANTAFVAYASFDEPSTAATPLTPSVQTRRPTDSMMNAIRSVRLVLRSNYLHDMLVTVKVAAVLVYLVYTVDLPGGYERYTVISLAAVCAGHLNIAASSVARRLLDPTPKSVGGGNQDYSLFSRVREFFRRGTGGGSSPNAAARQASKRAARRITALDVHVLSVIGTDLDEVTYRAFVFTLHGCIVPLLFTHVIPSVVLFFPYMVALTATLFISASLGRRWIRTVILTSHEHSALRPFVVALMIRAIVEGLTLWILQSAVLDFALYQEQRHRDPTPSRTAQLGAVVTEDVFLRLDLRGEYLSLVQHGGWNSWVPLLGTLL